MRYFVELAYNGKNYQGWQRQPNGPSVQEAIESAFSTVLNTFIQITGCGRTDTGVHARKYFFHFDFPNELPANFHYRINKFLAADIAIYRIIPVAPDAHARFDAYYRSYAYHINFQKDPFSTDTSLYFPLGNRLDISALQKAAQLMLQYHEFFPFCKTGHDAKTLQCKLYRSEWKYDEDRQHLTYNIAANRFLRGMVRLIVGMSLNVGMGKISLDEVQKALETQTRLKLSKSAAPEGLFLTEVKYPEEIFEVKSSFDEINTNL